MLRRSDHSRFVAGAHVFPGGAVDPADAGPELAELCLPGGSEEGLAYRIAAIRECFEEAGILLAERSGGRSLSDADPELIMRLRGHRGRLLESDADFLAICRAESLVPATSRLRYLSRWITPEGLPRRYDTRFFLAVAPRGQVAEACARETFDASWFRPTDALEQHRRDRIHLVLPTRRTLQELSAYRDTAEVLEGLPKPERF